MNIKHTPTADAIFLINKAADLLEQASDKKFDSVINALQAATMTLTLIELGVK